MSIRILVGDALERLRELPDESVHCVVTSPPYWGLRAYGGDTGMIGLEPTFDDHLANLVAVFCEVRRVLRGDGTLWLNYGDAYGGSQTAGRNDIGRADATFHGHSNSEGSAKVVKSGPVGSKQLMMMPARVAIALQADGWWLRSEIIWHKPNPMPESVQDRPTNAHEKVFLMSKRAKYFWDADAVREPHAPGTLARFGNSPHRSDNGVKAAKDAESNARRFESPEGAVGGANLRNVWSIATHAFPGAHFATFPPALVEPCIKAGTSAKGVCGKCGAPWVRDSVTEYGPTGKHGTGSVNGRRDQAGIDTKAFAAKPRLRKNVTTTGWQPSCKCNADVTPAVVLDCFAGSGTVGLVADRLGRDAILIELNPEYAAMAEQRIVGENPLFCKVEVKG